MITGFSWTRLWAVMIKEFIQIYRDKGTLGMIVAMPLLQVVLFGYAINSDPKHLPTMVVQTDHSPFTRSLIASMQNSDYFKITQTASSEQASNQALQDGTASFVINIPAGFSRDLIRGESPTILLQADSSDPSSTGSAVAALNQLGTNMLNHQLQGSLNYLAPTPPPFQVITHHLYNPAGITQYNIVPGLIGVVITMTMVMITAIAITRERERGTMESLLATPVQPSEVMMGKIFPYIIIGYVQLLLILLIGHLLFQIPLLGSISLLLIAAAPFIAANLAVGLLFSTVAKNQLQSVQMTIFFFLPSLLVSGFMFPFRGMPNWAQYLGEVLPLTHFLRIVRGILLKDNGWLAITNQFWPILLFFVGVILLGIKRFHRTLD